MRLIALSILLLAISASDAAIVGWVGIPLEGVDDDTPPVPNDCSAPAGTVIAQQPEAGASVMSGDTVHLSLSSGTCASPYRRTTNSISIAIGIRL